MRNNNFKIFFCILIGVLLLLAGYLLIDLHIISFGGDNKKDPPIEIVDPVGPPEEDSVVVPVIGEYNETETNSSIIPDENNNPTTTPTNPTQTYPTNPSTPNQTVKAQFEENSYTCYAGDNITTNVLAGPSGAIGSKYESSDKGVATVEKHPTLTTNCVGCTTVRINCKKAGKSTLTVTLSDGSKAKTTVQVLPKKISFAQSNYECVIGETISTQLTLASDMTDNIASYSSSNDNIVTIKNSTLQPNCAGCLMVDIICKSEGTVTLKANSRNGLSTTSTVKVNRPTSTISFDKAPFECEVGQTIYTELSVSNPLYDSIQSYASSDTSVATITQSSMQPKCLGCIGLDIKCLKPGVATLTGTSRYGSGTATTVKVKSDIGTISLGKSSFTCVQGEQFDFLVTARINNYTSGNVATIKSVTSSDTSIVSLKDSLLQTDCVGCHNYTAVCKKTGKVTLTAVSGTGARATAEVTVNNPSNNITFVPSSITCEKGRVVDLLVNYSGTVDSYHILYAHIATVKKSMIQPGGSGKLSLDVTCSEKGSTVLVVRLKDGSAKAIGITVK